MNPILKERKTQNSKLKRFFPVDTECIDISLFIIYSSFG